MKKFFHLFLLLAFWVSVLQAAPGLSPTVAEIRSSDNDCAAFTWNQPDSDGTIKGYYVYWGADETGVSDFFQNNNFEAESGAPSFDPPPVEDAGEYFLRVRAVDESGHGGGWATVLTYIYEGEYEEMLAELEEDEYEDEENIEIAAAESETELAAEAGGELLAEAAQLSGGDFVISNASFSLDGEDNPFVRPIMLPTVVFTADGVRYQDEETEESPQVALRPIILPPAVIADTAEPETGTQEIETEYSEEPAEKTETEILEKMFASAETEIDGAVFNPELPLSRKEMFKMIVRLLEEQGAPLPEKTIPQFSDLDAEQAAEVEKAARYGLLLGYPDGTARLDQPIRKAEAACVFARYSAALGENGGGAFLSAPVFADVPSTHWAYQEIARAQAFFAPSAENYFQPQTAFSRLDAAKALTKFKYVQDRRETLPPLTELPAPSANAAENAQISRLPALEKEQ